MFRNKNGMLQSSCTITTIIKNTLGVLHLDTSPSAVSYAALHIESLFQEYAKLMLIKAHLYNWNFEQIHVLNHMDDYQIEPAYEHLSAVTKAFLIQIAIHQQEIRPESDHYYLQLLQIVNYNPYK